MSNQIYQETQAMYTTQLRALFALPKDAPEEERKRGVTVDPSVLGERAETLADTSQVLGNQTSTFLDSSDQEVRESAEIKLLAQANAEMEVASALLAAVEEFVNPPGETRRASGTIAEVARSVDNLANVLDTPLEAGLVPFMDVKPTRGKSSDPAEAITALQDQVRRSLRDITRQASKTSSSALDTLFSLDSVMLKKAVAPVGKEISELVEKAAKGWNEKIKSLLRSAVRLLLQAYDWVLALIGKDAEEEARKKVQEWIEGLRASHKNDDDTPDLAEQIVSTIFTTKTINGEVAAWGKSSSASTDDADQAVKAVKALADGYAVKAERVQGFLETISVIPKVATAAVAALTVFNPPLAGSVSGLLPTIEVLRGAITLGLMGYTLYAGYDHVDSGKATFYERFTVNIPDRVVGVRKTAKKVLVVA